MSKFPLDFSKVEALRRHMLLTTSDMAEVFGVSRMTYYGWVKGKPLRKANEANVLGPEDPAIAEDIRLVDQEAGKLIDAARAADADVVVLSEYGITQVRQPIHINRILREAGYLRVRREPLGWETLDAGASRAFAVSDHQVAHVYVKNAADVSAVKVLLQRVPGIEQVLDGEQRKSVGLDHERSGELICVSSSDAWFTYYFWLDDQLAPDYARTVDIHRKPGYDPAELLVNPDLKWPKLRVASRLARKGLWFR